MTFVNRRMKMMDARMTRRARELLAQGELNVQYYNFGDLEIDYRPYLTSSYSKPQDVILNGTVFAPSDATMKDFSDSSFMSNPRLNTRIPGWIITSEENQSAMAGSATALIIDTKKSDHPNALFNQDNDKESIAAIDISQTLLAINGTSEEQFEITIESMNFQSKQGCLLTFFKSVGLLAERPGASVDIPRSEAFYRVVLDNEVTVGAGMNYKLRKLSNNKYRLVMSSGPNEEFEKELLEFELE